MNPVNNALAGKCVFLHSTSWCVIRCVEYHNRTCVYMCPDDLSNVLRKDLLVCLNLMTTLIEQSKFDRNANELFVDLRDCRNFSYSLISTLLSWIKSSKTVFREKLRDTNVLVQKGSMFVTVIQYLLKFVSTARPLHIHTLGSAPSFLIDTMNSLNTMKTSNKHTCK